jgi:outer membrane protein TolC
VRGWFLLVAALCAQATTVAAEPVSLTLPEAVGRARSVNADLRALRARLAQQSATVRIALARVLPTLSVTGTYFRNDQQVEAAGRVVVRQHELSLFGGAQVGLFRPAALGDWLVSDAELDAATLAATQEAAGVELTVIELFIGVRRAEARLASATAAVARRSEFLRAASARLEHELTDRSEVQRAELLLADAQLELDAARADQAALLVALAAVLQLPPEPSSLALTGSGAAPEVQAPPSWDLTERGDIRAVQLLLDERDDLANTFAWLRFLPTIDLAGTFAQEEDSFSNPDGFTWRIEVQATWFLYDGGERYGVLDLAESTTELHRAELLGLEADIRAEARTALIRIDQLERQLATARASLATATQYREDVGRRLDAGLATLLDVLDAEAQLSGAEVLASTLAHDLDLARWRLLHARGELTSVLP